LNVLVFAAHPDDEVLGMGGTIGVHVDRGDVVHVVCVTDGSSSQYPGDEALRTRKNAEAQRAATILGVDSYVHLDLPDMKLDTVPHIELNGIIDAHVHEFAPAVVYTPQPDINLDHRALFDSVAVGVRPRADQIVRRVLTYAIPSSIEWTPAPTSSFRPNWFVDITGALDRKLEAFACFETEAREHPHPRSERALRALAEYFGSLVGVEHAEPFVLVRNLERL
jgi:N-acetylglucosamine malate deacetylase 1